MYYRTTVYSRCSEAGFFLVEPKFEGGLGTIKTVNCYLFSSSTGNTYKNEMRLKTNYSNATRTPGDESGRKRAGC